MEITYTKQTLDNELDVIVHEDHGCPIVAVNLWYHVGSKNEQPGRTGFAHLFEHLMFEGSAHHEAGYFRPLQEVGGALNGSTNADRTNYWDVVPSSALDRALWMESDRMGYLLPALTQRKLDAQRDVVLNERRQNYENCPYGMSLMALMAAHYPPAHPYHWPTIGASEDLRAARLDEVREFFATYYQPGNASLVVAGDVEADRALQLASRYFEEIPGGPSPAPVDPPPVPVPNEAKPLVLEDRVELSRLYLAWRTPALFAPGDAELDLLADSLAGSKSSRLYRALVLERRIATEVSVAQSSRELSSLFIIVATAAPGHSLAELDGVITEELEHMTTDGPTDDELERSRACVESNFLNRQQTVGGFGGRSDQLNAYNVFVGNPGYFAGDFERYFLADTGLIRATASTYLRRQMRIALSVVPRGSVASNALPGSVPAGVA